MSGKKWVNITSEEYARLLEAAERLRTVESNLPEILDSMARLQVDELQTRLQPLEQRQRSYEASLAGLHSDIAQAEQRTASRLAEQQRRMREELARAATNIRAEAATERKHIMGAIQDVDRRARELVEASRRETRELLRQQQDLLTDMIAAEREEREAQVAALQEALEEIYDDEQRKLELAEDQLEVARTLRDSIARDYQHERFTPGQLAKIDRVLSQAEADLAASMADATLARGQDAHLQLRDLAADLDRLETEWEMARAQALAEVQGILEEAKQNRTVPVEAEQDGQPRSIEFEVDWWTNGGLSALEAQLQEQVIDIAQNHDLTTEELQEIAERRSKAYRERLHSLLTEAAAQILSSQIRVSVADHVVDVLEAQGFEVEGGVYEGTDQRNRFVAKTLHPDGGELVVVVRTPDDAPATATVEINQFPPKGRTISDAELRRRAEGVHHSLQRAGLAAGPLEDAGQPGDETVRDLDSVRTRATQ